MVTLYAKNVIAQITNRRSLSPSVERGQGTSVASLTREPMTSREGNGGRNIVGMFGLFLVRLAGVIARPGFLRYWD
jgi:hypothetical protein